MSKVEVRAIAKDVRISPRKVGLVAALVRRRTVEDSLTILENTPKEAAQPIIKLINSAAANARNNLRVSADDSSRLRISTIMVTEGLSLKRYKFIGKGRKAIPRPMQKRSSHITVVLSSDNQAPSSPKAKKDLNKGTKSNKQSPDPKPEKADKSINDAKLKAASAKSKPKKQTAKKEAKK